jgi:hypothetical protein
MLKFISINKFLLITILVVVGYLIIDKFQIYLLTGINAQSSENLFASYIYLPNGFRVIIAVILGPISFIGLFFAHLITGYNAIQSLNGLIILASTLSTIAPYLSIYIIYKKFNVNVYEIKIDKIILLSLLSSFLNSFFSVSSRLIFNFYETKIFSTKFIQFFIGDVLGVCFLFFLIIILNILKKIFIKTK